MLHHSAQSTDASKRSQEKKKKKKKKQITKLNDNEKGTIAQLISPNAVGENQVRSIVERIRKTLKF